MSIEDGKIINPAEKAETFYPKPSWFKAYHDGNLLLPLRFKGQKLMVTEALLSDPPTDMTQFEKSELSPEQLGFLRKLAEGAHKAHGIEASFDDAVLQNQWGQTVVEVILNLDMAYGDFVDLQDFNSEKLNKLRDILEKFIFILKHDQNVKRYIIDQHRIISQGQNIHKAISNSIPNAYVIGATLREAFFRAYPQFRQDELAIKAVNIYTRFEDTGN